MSGFNGTWKLDVSGSKMWDAEKQDYAPETVGEEIITIKVEGGVQDYEVLYGDDPVIRMGYTSVYDDTTWVPYLVREIITDSPDPDAAVAEFKTRVKADQGAAERRFELGKPYGWVRTVYVDPRTHYRLARTDDGEALYVMMRRLAEDEQSYVATLLDRDGIVYRIRKFDRVSG
jgi:hypothetical protein